MGGLGSDMLEYFKIPDAGDGCFKTVVVLQVMGGQGSDMLEYFKILMLVMAALRRLLFYR